LPAAVTETRTTQGSPLNIKTVPI